MPLIQVLLVLIVVGVILWLINRFIPMQSTIKGILNAVVVIVVVLWLLNVFGLLHQLSNIRIGHAGTKPRCAKDCDADSGPSRKGGDFCSEFRRE